MVLRTGTALPDLYVEDETAWLEAMADLIDAGAVAELDYRSLREYLCDMAKRDRREVESRLVVLLLHVLKWVHQPSHRSPSWQGSIIEQRQELDGLLGRGVLRNHAEAVLPDAYAKAVERAIGETRLPVTTFWSLARIPWNSCSVRTSLPSPTAEQPRGEKLRLS